MSRILAALLIMSLAGCAALRGGQKSQQETTAPKKPAETRSDVVACSHLMVEADWQGAEAVEKKQTCTYAAPANCLILYSPTTVHTENNGFHQTVISVDGKSLTSTVLARPHGTAAKPKKSWIDISVMATLDCKI